MKDCLPLILLFWVTALIGASGLDAAERQIGAGGLRAGAATSNITPELGGDIVGGFVPVTRTDIHDELHPRCLVLDDGKELLALVVCDLLGLHRMQERPIRWRVVEAPLLACARETEQRTQATGDGTSLPALYSGRVQRLAQASTETKAPAQVPRIGERGKFWQLRALFLV